MDRQNNVNPPMDNRNVSECVMSMHQRAACSYTASTCIVHAETFVSATLKGCKTVLIVKVPWRVCLLEVLGA
jgi:hypothetical protein